MDNDERFWCPLCESVQLSDGMHECRRAAVNKDDFIEAVKLAVKEHAPCIDDEGRMDEFCEFYVDIAFLVKKLAGE